MVLTATELEKYADVLLWGLSTARKTKFRKGDIILIQYERPALQLAEILFRKIVVKWACTRFNAWGSPSAWKGFFEKANDKQLVFIPPGEKELYGNMSDGYSCAPRNHSPT